MPLKLSHGMGAWIKDFQKSDAPQFKGKSDKERRDQAIAAYLSAKRDANENYVSHAQRKAVWANRADGGKGHPDNKKKNESVHSADKKPEKYIDDKGITKTRMVPTDKNVVKNEAAEYDSGWKKSPQDRKDQYGNPVKAKNVPKKLAKMGMKQHDKDDKKKNEGVEEGGLWANIHAKRKRIKNGSGERMRKPGSKGAPTDKDFKDAQESVQHKSFFDLREATKCKTATAKRVAEDMKSAAAELSKYANTHGGMDKADFQKAAKHMEAGDHKSLHKQISKLDTDPRDKILTTLHKHGNDIKRYGYATEEVEQIDELSKSTLRSYIDKKSDDHESNKNAVADARDALRKHQRNKPSLDAPLKHQFDHNAKKRELEKDVNVASRTATRSNVNLLKAKKRLNKEETEQVDELSNDMLQRYKKKAGAAASAADKKGDVKTGNKRFSGIMKATTKQFKNDLKKESDASWEKGQEKEKEKRLTPNDKDKLAKIRAMLAREKK